MVLFFVIGCNIFEWSYSEEKSSDFKIIIASADAYLRNQDYDKALALYDRAVMIRSNAAIAYYGRICARLLKQTKSRSIIQVFPEFFKTTVCTDPMFKNYSTLAMTDLLRTIKFCNNDFDAILRPHPLSDGSCNTNSASFKLELTFVKSMRAALRLLDNNTNNIPRESADIFQLSCGFALNSPAGLSPFEATNAVQTLIEVTNLIHFSSNTLYWVFQNDLIENVLIEPFSRLRDNINTFYSNTTQLITNIEAQL